jgi:hypothetical protein
MGDAFFRIRALARLEEEQAFLQQATTQITLIRRGVGGTVADRRCRTDRRIVSADCQSVQITRRNPPLDPSGHEGRMSRQMTATRYKVGALVTPHRVKAFIQ